MANTFPLLDLPDELIIAIAAHWDDHPFALPTASINRRLFSLFSPAPIVAQRAISHADGSRSRALRLEAIRGSATVCKALLETLPRIGFPSRALVAAAGGPHPDVVQLLLKFEDGDVEKRHLDSAVRRAAATGSERTVRLLVGAGGDPNAALAGAALKGHVELARVLLDELGADPDFEEARAVEIACEAGHLPIARLLLTRGAVLLPDSPSARRAAANGHVDILRFLYSVGWDPTIPTYPAASPIVAAAARGQVEAVEWLIEAGADVSVGGDAALRAAVDAGRAEVARVLERAGAKYEKAFPYFGRLEWRGDDGSARLETESSA
ncbi:ankyrin [Gonapodya prolifera JEL478]|uniref:Ankyrin n=1 Tax=Gonapodya prolifera (strain JEL478) TaxID=1344416 RepID=A0A139AYR0_GONPJ|nr:ankyrin [Gonapodya prolifera JEL478]|eukprot:KXS21595.1 ankyrin [Gonapodya prolifera JEL478]